MNRKVVLGIVTAILLFSILVVANQFFNRGRVNIRLDGVDNVNVSIFKASDEDVNKIVGNVIKTINNSGEVVLKKGSYVAKIQNNGFEQNEVPFNVSGDLEELVIPVSFTDSALAKIAQEEKDAITKSIRSSVRRFNQNTDSIPIITLYRTGQWAVGILQTSRAPADYYRVVLEKVNGKWRVLTTPEIVLQKKIYGDIPVDILRKANSIQSNNPLQDPTQEVFTGDGLPPEELGL